MPNWKKLIVSGSDAELNSLNATTALTASGLLYPTIDGNENQALITDGAGNLSFGVPISSSYALTASYVDIEDGAFSGSFSGSFYGDGSNITGITVSQTSTVTSSFTNVISTVVNHNFDSKNILVSIYDTNDSQIIPETVTLTDNDNVSINFAITSSGYVVVAKGGHIVSGSINNAVSSSYATTASYIASSGVDGPLGMDSVTSSSYALTASYADSFNANNIIVNQITASVISASYIDLDVLANGDTPPHKAGRIFFGAEEGALSVYNEEADITLQLGQEFYIRAFNPTGNTILNGTPVRASGSQGDRIAIYPALAEDHTTGKHFDSHIIGLATHNIGPSTEGYVTAQGIVRGIDTQAFSAGDTLYLQTGSAGLRNSPPPFPYDIVQVGYASKIDSNGFVFVEPKEPVHFSNISGLSGSYVVEPGELWVYQSNNAWTHTRTLSGSYVIDNGGLTANSFTGSLLGTASYAANADLLDGLNSSQFLRNDQSGTVTGDLTVTGTVTAQEFHTEFVSASIIYESGSTQFGNSSDDTHIFTGSILVEGGITGSINHDGHLLPTLNNTHDLGSSDLRFRDLYLSSASIYLGNTIITENNIVTTSSLVNDLPSNIISSSAQIANDISGAFNSVSQSLSTRVNTNEENINSLTTATGSYLLNTTDTLDGDLTVTNNITGSNILVNGNITTTTINNTDIDTSGSLKQEINNIALAYAIAL